MNLLYYKLYIYNLIKVFQIRSNSPCTLKSGRQCASPYGYKNQMPLTENVILFEVITISI